ncbi:MAG: hypothetical protein HY292_20190 [Planctomycetes bacterium]|nr:hypothetical protein [Planctomycetota bacterium]
MNRLLVIAGSSVASYALWAWPGAPASPTPLRASGSSLGCTVAPTPLAAPRTPQPFGPVTK